MNQIPSNEERIQGAVNKYSTQVNMIQVLIKQDRWSKEELYDTLHSLMGYCQRGDLWDVAQYVGLMN